MRKDSLWREVLKERRTRRVNDERKKGKHLAGRFKKACILMQIIFILILSTACGTERVNHKEEMMLVDDISEKSVMEEKDSGTTSHLQKELTGTGGKTAGKDADTVSADSRSGEDILSAYIGVLNTSPLQEYVIYDIDKDHIPEMILAESSGTFADCCIYTYENGAIKVGEEIIHYGLYSCQENGLIFKSGGSGVVTYETKYLDEKVLRQGGLSLSAAYVPGMVEQYLYNDKEITAEEFEQLEPKESDRLILTDKSDQSVLASEIDKYIAG